MYNERARQRRETQTALHCQGGSSNALVVLVRGGKGWLERRRTPVLFVVVIVGGTPGYIAIRWSTI